MSTHIAVKKCDTCYMRVFVHFIYKLKHIHSLTSEFYVIEVGKIDANTHHKIENIPLHHTNTDIDRTILEK